MDGWWGQAEALDPLDVLVQLMVRHVVQAHNHQPHVVLTEFL